VLAAVVLSSRTRQQRLTIVAAALAVVVVVPLVIFTAARVAGSTASRLAAQAPSAAATPLPPTPTPCRFVAGFATLGSMIPEVIGDCTEWEQADPLTGDTQQRTSTGLLAWRKQDNSTAFTDGQGTWVNGPNGLAYRPNTVRFPWESNPAALPVLAENHPSIAVPGALLPAQRVITYYGNPLTPAMGILGQRTPEQMMNALEQQAQQYAAADPLTPVKMALHLVSTVATDTPGPDGLYRRRASAEEIERVAGWAQSRGHLLILDIQPGWASTRSEVEALLPYLERPYVHLALDPEWAMRPGQVPGQFFGTIDAAAVNETIQMLARVVSRHKLPPKLLIVHRFTRKGVTGYEDIRLDPRVQIVMHMDGFGPPWLKRDSFYSYIKKEPVQFVGWKQFTKRRNDNPPTPKKDILRLNPVPLYIQYQ
jgi:hypothetical protein